MAQKRKEPIWPLLSILVCLFVLSATSPMIWESAARRRGWQAALSQAPARQQEPAKSDSAGPGAPSAVGRADAPGSDSPNTLAPASSDAPCPAVAAAPTGLLDLPVRVTSVSTPVALARPLALPKTPPETKNAPETQAAASDRAAAPPAAGEAPKDAASRPASEASRPLALEAPKDDPDHMANRPMRVSRPRSSGLESLRAMLLPDEPLPGHAPMPPARDAIPPVAAQTASLPPSSAPKEEQTAPDPKAMEPEPALAAKKPVAPDAGAAHEEAKPPLIAEQRPADDKAADSKPAEQEAAESAPAAPPARESIAADASKPDSRPEAKPAPDKAASRPEPKPAPSDAVWPPPEALFEELRALAGEPDAKSWADAVEQAVRTLGPAMSEGGEEARARVAELRQLGEQGLQRAAQIGERSPATALRRAVYSLERRLAIWQPVVQAGGLKPAPSEAGDADPQGLEDSLSQVDALLTESPEGHGWRRFLELDALRKLTASRTAPRDGQARATARKILDRITQSPMKAPQRRFLGQGPLAALARELRRVSCDPVDLKEVLRHLEQYEREPTPRHARPLAEDCQRLLCSKVPARQAIGQGLESYYRNANLRLVASDALLNRFIPERPPEYGHVRDVVLGNPVHGRALTETKVGLRLVPDPEKFHAALEVKGLVAASTHSVAGPATFYNDSQSVYYGWKEVEIGAEGMRVYSARVAVNNDLELRGLSTDFDELPLIGALAQGVARSQHQQKRCEMVSELERKVAVRAKSQIDSEADARLSKAAERIRAAVLDPLEELSLGPAFVSAETTDRRVAMRLRLASERQLGGHTPRPQAPADSVASLQVHESALNNALEQLHLDGATFSLPKLRERISSRLQRTDLFRGGSENDDVTIAFAQHNAARVACRDGLIVLALSVARLAKPPHAWSDFEVRVLLRPSVHGRSVELVREDVIHLIGNGLSFRSQIALRGIFSKTFAKDRPIAAMPDRVINDPRLADVVFTQFVVEDGWVAAALGTGRVARKDSTSPPAQPRVQ